MVLIKMKLILSKIFIILIKRIYITLNGFENEKKNEININFTESSIDLKVHDINNKNYRLNIPILFSKINKAEFKTQKDKINIILEKTSKGINYLF
jgi:hypothetical protein